MELANHTISKRFNIIEEKLEYDGGEWLAILPELEIYGDGLTEGEAIEDLKSELLDLYEDLNSIRAQKLGRGLLAKKRVINKIVRKTKTR
jgi:hypothetical protein